MLPSYSMQQKHYRRRRRRRRCCCCCCYNNLPERYLRRKLIHKSMHTCVSAASSPSLTGVKLRRSLGQQRMPARGDLFIVSARPERIHELQTAGVDSRLMAWPSDAFKTHLGYREQRTADSTSRKMCARAV